MCERKTMRKFVAGTAVVAALTLAPSAAFAQEQQAQEESNDDDNGEVGLIGLAGLLGLAGLAGLARRDRRPDYNRGRSDNAAARGAANR
jgi:MYXO-CTERM domain-containing protein